MDELDARCAALRKQLEAYRDDPPVSLNWYDVARLLLALLDELETMTEHLVALRSDTHG